MALEASHIRFALDIKDTYDVTDLSAYVSGSIYPDSRYVTKIDRTLTHPEEYLTDPMFRMSDFKKGWHAHLLCDTVQGVLMGEMLPMVASDSTEQSWIERSAIKILQDASDVRKYDILTYLSCLTYVENPNGEDIETLRWYNGLCAKTYLDPQKIGIKEGADIYRNFGVQEDLVLKIQSVAEEFAKDARIMEQVEKLYDAMIFAARKA